jgi:NADH:ubiquinone oxidoreductase subunit K
MWRRLGPPTRAPLVIAGLLAFPLFFASLLAVTLAIERPHRFQWMRRGRLIEVDHQPTTAQEAKIWALSLVVPAILVGIGFAAAFWRRGGVYVVGAAAIAIAVALPHRLDRWTAHHTTRFPFGMDLVPDSNVQSSTLARGEWEGQARETVISLTHWTLGAAVAAIAIAATVALHRRLRPAAAVPVPPLAVATGEAEASPVLAPEQDFPALEG